jgi:hypothetical protein
MKQLRYGIIGVIAMAVCLSADAVSHLQAQGQSAQGKTAAVAEKAAPGDPSLKTVKILIGETITLIPSEITKPDGTVVKFDKSDLNKIIVPYEDAVRIIKVANMSAEANLCDMPEVEAQNWDALRTHEIAKKKWSDQQLFFINRLHFLVVVTRTGKYQVVAEGDSKEKSTAATVDMTKKPTCTEAEKNDIRNKLEAYWVAEDKKLKKS